jgi:chorismate--pyruvate lyase
MLFADPHLLRGDFELALIGPDDPLVPAGLRGAHALWARRSVFRLRGKPLLVQEVFLPACRIGRAAASVYSPRMP